MNKRNFDQTYSFDELASIQLQLYKRAFCALLCAMVGAPFLWSYWGLASLLTTFMFVLVSIVFFWLGSHPNVALADRSPRERRLYDRAFSSFFLIGATPFVLESLGTAAFLTSVVLLAGATGMLLGLAHRGADW